MNILTDPIESSLSNPETDKIWVAIIAQNVQNLAAFQMDINYDAEQLEYLDFLKEIYGFPEKKQILEMSGGSTIGFCQKINENTINISFSLTNSSPDITANGSGYLIFLRFQLKQMDQYAQLNMNNVLFIDSDNHVEHITDVTNGIVNPSYRIEGNVYYWYYQMETDPCIYYTNALLPTGQNLPLFPLEDYYVSNVHVNLLNNSSQTAVTSITGPGGHYSFTGLSKNQYTLSVSKNDHLFGLDPVDVSLIARYLNNVISFDFYEKKIADVNQDGIVSKEDYEIIAQYGIGINDHLKKHWLLWTHEFDADSYCRYTLLEEFDDHYDLFLDENRKNMHFMAARSGDVNHNWLVTNDQLLHPYRKSTDHDLVLQNTSKAVKTNSSLAFDIDLDKRTGIPEAIFLFNNIRHKTDIRNASNNDQTMTVLKILSGFQNDHPENKLRRRRSCATFSAAEAGFGEDNTFEIPLAIDNEYEFLAIEGIAIAVSGAENLSLVDIRLENELLNEHYETFYHQKNNQIIIWLAATKNLVRKDGIIAYLKFQPKEKHCLSYLSVSQLECNNQEINGGFFQDEQLYDCLEVGMGCGFTILAQSSALGTITPSGTIAVKQFESKQFTMIADENALIDGVWIDNIYQGKMSSYVFPKIIKDHKIFVRFKPFPRLVVAKPVRNISIKEDAGDIKIDLKDRYLVRFDDEKTYNIVKTIIPLSASAPVSCKIENNILTLSFKENAYGKATIGIIARCDEFSPVTDTFNVMITPVNDPPKIENIMDLTLPMSSGITTIPLTISDIDTPVEHIIVKAHSSNTTLIPDRRQFINVDGILMKSLHLRPAPGEFGAAIISLELSDGWSMTKTTFQLTVEKKEYTITSFIGENGQSNHPLSLPVLKGKNVIYRFKPDVGYRVDQVRIDDQLYKNLDTYTFYAVSDHHFVSATFKNAVHYMIEATANEGGQLQPSGFIEVAENQHINFRIKANNGYIISNVYVDDFPVGPVNHYLLNQINDNHSITAEFILQKPPVADFEYKYVNHSVPLLIHFSNTSSNQFTKQIWNFGDGQTSQQLSPKHIYTEPGAYTVTLYVEGPGGEDTIEKKQCITARSKQLDFAISPRLGHIPLEVQLSNLSIGYTAVKWDFGDGTISDNMTHVYTKPGIYSITATVLINEQEFIYSKPEAVHVYGRTITGKVMAEKTNSPVPDCFINIWNKHSTLLSQTTTDDYGNYTLSSLPLLDDLVIAVWPDIHFEKQYYLNQQTFARGNRISTRNKDLSQINFLLKQRSQYGIIGTVKDKNGHGVPNIAVKTISRNFQSGASATTDSNGNYTLTGLLPDSLYRIAAWSKDLQKEFFYAIPKSESYTQYVPLLNDTISHPGEATWVIPEDPFISNIDIYMHSMQTISGRIVDTEGNPLEKISVQARTDSLNMRYSALSDNEGKYTITGLTAYSDSAQISYWVEIDCQGYPYQIYPMTDNQDEAISILAGSTGIDFTLKTRYQISGLITDQNAVPLPYVSVQIWSFNHPSQKNGKAVTDMTGKYSITNLPPGNDYILAAFSQQYPTHYYGNTTDKNKTQKIVLDALDQDHINFSLSKGALMMGYVFIENEGQKRPAPEGTVVNVWSNETQTGKTCEIDMDGFYEISGLDYRVADYRISAFQESYMTAYYQRDISQTTVYSIKEASMVSPSYENKNMLLKKGLTLKGKVMNQDTLVNGIQINVFSKETGKSGHCVSSKVQPDGNNYVISELPPGMYTIQTFSTFYDTFLTSNVMINADLVYDIPLKKPALELSGIISDFPIACDAKIYVWSDTLQWGKEQDFVVDAHFYHYSISNLKPASDYIVSMLSNAAPTQYYKKTNDSKPSFVDLTEGNVKDVNFDFPENLYHISGQIFFPENAQTGEQVNIQAVSDKENTSKTIEVIFQNTNPVIYKMNNLIQSDDYIVSLSSKHYPTLFFQSALSKSMATSVSILTASAEGIDFTLNSAATISGMVYMDGNPASDIEVTAESKTARFARGVKTSTEGIFVVQGLPLVSDIVLKAKIYDSPPFYYHQSGEMVRNRQQTTTLSSIHGDISDIVLTIATGDTISGIIFSADGHPLENIPVNAWSAINGSGNAALSESDGRFQVKNLQTGSDYIVTVNPVQSSYLSQHKENIFSQADNIIFFLSQGYTMSGTVKDTSGQVIDSCSVKLISEEQSILKESNTNNSGQYTFTGLPQGNDYVLKIIPDKNTNLAVFQTSSIVLQFNQTINITLLPAYQLNGYVHDIVGSPISDVQIILSSEKTQFQKKVFSDNNGYYALNNIPEADDYIVRAIHQKYCKQTKSITGFDYEINFIMTAGDVIYGSINNSDGLPIINATVRAYSSELGIDENTITDFNGKYKVSGLTDKQNNFPVNYIVEVYIDNILMQRKMDNYTGENVSFVITSGDISVTIRDIEGDLPPEELQIYVYVFEENAKFPIVLEPDQSGTFQAKNLSSEKKYKFLVQVDNRSEWIGDNGIGTQDMSLAQSFSPGEIITSRLSESW
jgi:PKD repeat protein